MLSFFQMLFTFYHQGYELAKDFDHYKTDLHLHIQNVSLVFPEAVYKLVLIPAFKHL